MIIVAAVILLGLENGVNHSARLPKKKKSTFGRLGQHPILARRAARILLFLSNAAYIRCLCEHWMANTAKHVF